MTTAQLEKKLLHYTKGLPKETLQEIINFVQFLKQKKTHASESDTLSEELAVMNDSQVAHLEEEFKEYKKQYPRE